MNSIFKQSTDYGYVFCPFEETTTTHQCMTLLDIIPNSNISLNTIIKEYHQMTTVPIDTSLEKYWKWLNSIYIKDWECKPIFIV